ncbi:4434_t:CDS:10 [Diversispora eburnea]|uniref:Large ribosomal subunit protein mL50 n=1 Tax=Diversispora eburnea TaxID=1213867 RepID=A0A9N9F2F3_9GLOM|nr:4434_t:CDS:10 [Diversispora eburnea]
MSLLHFRREIIKYKVRQSHHTIFKASFSHTPTSNREQEPSSYETLLDEIKTEGVEGGIKQPTKLKDQSEIKSTIYNIYKTHVQSGVQWMDFKLENQSLKFTILRDCMSKTGRIIPNLDLNNMKTMNDVVRFYLGEEKRDNRIGHPVAEWFIANKDKLPLNMKFIPYVKERGVKREERSKKQKIPKKEKQRLAVEKARKKELLAQKRKLKQQLEYALQHRGQFPDPGPWKIPQTKNVLLRDTLGIEALPRQRFNKTKRTPYVLNIMVVGESGLGKTTFMNTLFNTPLKEEIYPKNPQSTQTVEISPVHYELVEDGVKLNLTVVDTPGFGDQLNRENNLDPIVEYIDNQFEVYHAAERSSEFRRAIPDTRIHALLYFIPPTGHALKELDIKALQVLSAKVNVIPVIAKADTLTREEKAAFKKTILRDIENNAITIFPTAYPDDRESVEDLEKYIPFTVIGSDQFVDIGGKKVRGRSYRWGVVEVHYHNYRAQKLRSSGRPESILACDDSYEHRIERSKQSMAEDMIKKEEEMRQNFVMKVREKEANLREREEQRQQLMAELEEQRSALAAEEREFQEFYNASRNAT